MCYISMIHYMQFFKALQELTTVLPQQQCNCKNHIKIRYLTYEIYTFYENIPVHLTYPNPFIRGGALRARITFTARFDPLGVKIARRYFWTFPKHAQIRH